MKWLKENGYKDRISILGITTKKEREELIKKWLTEKERSQITMRKLFLLKREAVSFLNSSNIYERQKAKKVLQRIETKIATLKVYISNDEQSIQTLLNAKKFADLQKIYRQKFAELEKMRQMSEIEI